MAMVFTYGTLEIQEVMKAVTGRRFASWEALAHNYACYLLKERIYPGMTSTLNRDTKGRCYLDVDSHSLWLLDQFEDPIYRRETIFVRIPSKKITISAYAYIIPKEHQDSLSNQSWKRQDFIDSHLNSYVASCQLFHRRMGD